MLMKSILARILITAGLVSSSGFLYAGSNSSNENKAAANTPKRVMIVVFDQMRPEYAEMMPNVKRLQKEGVNFKNGYVGHIPSETVISHNVIVSGVFPKNQGWTDEGFRDVRNLLGKGKDTMWISGSLNAKQFGTLIRDRKYPKLADYLHVGRPGTKFIVVTNKGYVGDSIGAPNGDIAVRLSGRQKDVTKETGCDNLNGQWRYPDGKNVPTYLTEPKCGRFYVNSDKGNHYGTGTTEPAWTYAHDGDRMIGGNNPDHQGGDVWTADAAMLMMEKENWSGMVISFSAIDKAAHMWGAYHDKEGVPGTEHEKTHVPNIVRVADEQFGRVLDKMKELGQLDETLIVITADHAGTYGRTWYGRNEAGASDTNWMYGETVNEGNFDKPIDALKPLVDTGNLQFTYQSSMMEAWLKDNSTAKKREAAKIMATIDGIVATFWRDGDHFVLEVPPGKGKANYDAESMAWYKKHGQELVNTMASENGPDVVGFAAEETLYGGAIGDHGSNSRNDQHIPMVFWSKQIKSETPEHGQRLVDVVPTVLKAMKIYQNQPGDGKAYPLKFK